MVREHEVVPSLGADVDAARRGSDVALGRALETCREYLLLVAKKELGGELGGKLGPSDVVQETLIRAHQGFAAFRGVSEGEFLAWVRAILANELVMARRRYSAAKRGLEREMALEIADASWKVDPRAEDPTPSDVMVADERDEHVQGQLATLPADYQEVLRYRYWEDLTLPEIADKMGRSADAVRKLWYRALESLARQMNEADRADGRRIAES